MGAVTVGALCASLSSQGQTIYWNGGTSGSWNTTTSNKAWYTTSTGSGGSKVVWANGDNAYFSAGSPTGNFTITVNGAVTVGNITFQDGSVSIGGTSTISLVTTTNTFTTMSNPASIAAPIAGSGRGIIVTGPATLTLSGANTYSGVTKISSGTLAVTTLANGGTASAIGSAATTASNLVLDNGTLQYTGSGDTTNRLFTIGAGGATLDASGTGALNFNGTGSAAFSGTGNRTLTLTGTSTADNTLAPVLGNPSGATLAVDKSGAGTWTLSGINTYSGGTTISAGTLVASGTASALGAGNVTLSGGTLVLENNSGLNFGRNVTVTANSGISADTVTSGSAGVTHTMGTLSIGGAQLDVGLAAPNTTSGTAGITFGATNLTGDSTINVVNGSGSSSVLTLGALNDGGTARTLTKTGSGTVTLSSAATSLVNGTTVNISAGTVNSNNATALGTLANVTVSSGATLSLGAAQTLAALNGGGTVALGTNALTLGNTGNNLSSAFSGALTGSGTVTKTGSGTVTLSGASSGYTGAIAINQGTLVAAASNALGSGTAGTNVSSGAALGISGNSTVGNGNLTITGTGVSNSGALYGSTGSNTYNGSVSLAGNATIAGGGTLLTIGGTSPGFTPSGHTQPTESGYVTIGGRTLTFSGSGTIQVNDRIQDFSGQTAGTSYSSSTTVAYAPETTNPGNVVVDMSSGGVVHYYANANSYTGTTFIKNGTLLADTVSNGVAPHDPNTDSFHAINGAVVIGNGTSSATLKLGSLANEILASTSTIKLYSDGTFDLNGQTQTIDALTFSGGGTVQLGTGSLYLNNDVTFNATAGQTASITSTNGAGFISMTLHRATNVDTATDATRTFTVTGDATSNLTINAIIQSGNLVKAGTGKLTLTDANTYLGNTTVNGGILNVQFGTDANGHSALGSSDGTDTQGTTVANGATLQVQGGITLTTEKLNLNGTGYSGGGALENVSGNNTWGTGGTALINLQSDSRINSDAGKLSIVTNITSNANNALTFGGAGNTTVSGSIITGSGNSTTVTKDGTGTLTLSGSNGYQGATTVSSGVLSLQNNYGLGATTGGTTVATGAQLQLDNTANGNLTVAAEALTLNGTGIGGSGALLNAAGSNTFTGLVTLGSASLVAANTSTSLVLSGGTSSANYGLTIGTTGNTGNVTINGAMSNGTGSLTKDGAGAFTYSGATSGTTTGNVGAIALNGGSMKVGDGSHVTTLNGTGLVTATNTSLLIATGGTMSITGNATLNGTIDSASSGTLQINGGNTLTFNSTINAANLTLVFNGGSIGTNAAPDTVFLGNLGATGSVTVGNIHITGDTILDFGNSAGTFLSSTNLVVDPGVKVTVVNWISVANTASQSTIWYLRNLNPPPTPSLNQTITQSGTDILGGAGLNQISFTNPVGSTGNTTTWVDGNHDGWFDQEIRPTPEPATYGVIFMSGCVGLFGWRTYRRRRQATSGA